MTFARTSGLARLAEISGSAHVMAEPADLALYRIAGQMPAVAVRPSSAEEAAEIVKFAAAERLAVVPAAGRTKLDMGMPPKKYDMSLDLSRLDRVIAYDPGDLTLSVEPGIPLQRLSGVLAGHRQFLPLAAPFAPRATAGGTLAAGVDSPLRQFYGTARDYVLGIEFVTGDGVRAKSGGRVVKNVSGYDLHKLMIGALGTLGILTQINFRTFPLPGETWALAASFDGAAGALDFRSRVANSPLRPLTLEILSPETVVLLAGEEAARIEPGPAPEAQFAKGKWTVAASFAGKEPVLERYTRDLRQMAGDSGASGVLLFSDRDTSCNLARLREFVPVALASSPAATVLKLSVLPSRLRELLDAVCAAAELSDLPRAVLARGLGVVYAALLPAKRDSGALRRVVQATGQILNSCAGLGGNSSIPWCPGEWKESLSVWGPDRSDFAQMRKLKSVFDPAGILAPGRFAGGM